MTQIHLMPPCRTSIGRNTILTSTINAKDSYGD